MEEALKRHGALIYVRHESIHNAYVVKDFEARGVVFINQLDQVLKGAILILALMEFPRQFGMRLMNDNFKCLTLLVR